MNLLVLNGEFLGDRLYLGCDVLHYGRDVPALQKIFSAFIIRLDKTTRVHDGLLILQSFDWLAAYHLDLLQAIVSLMYNCLLLRIW
jgi:hypothetical protein